MAAWRAEALGGREDLRLPPAETLHMTLAFLGHRPEAQIAAIARAGLSSLDRMRAPVLSPRAVVGVPRRRPRLLALDLEDAGGRAAAVQTAVEQALAAASLHTPDRRAFWPHLTLARARGGGRQPLTAAPIGSDSPQTPLRFDRLSLYRSHLGPSGARYEALERRELAY